MAPEARSVWEGLEFRRPMMLRNVEPLSEDQLRWVPGPGRNAIAWQLWHIAEVEDNWIRTCLLGDEPHFPFLIPLNDARPDQYPGKADLLEYLVRVRELSRVRLGAMASEDFDRTVTDPDFGRISARALWAGVVTSFAWHAGQIALTAKLIPDSPVKVWNFTSWTQADRKPV